MKARRALSRSVRAQYRGQRGRKIYSLHAPEAECTGKGRARRPYESGVKAPVATTPERSKGGQFLAHVKALPGNPCDGHMLKTILSDIEKQTCLCVVPLYGQGLQGP